LEQNPSAQEQLLSSYDVIGDSIWNPMNMREEIKSLNVEATEKLLKYSSAYYKKNPNYYPGWDSEKMAQVYQNSEFLLETNGFGNVEKWSIGLSAIRRLEQQGMELSSANLGSAINEIISAREQNKERVILGKDTTYIPITNDEKWGDDFISRMIGERGGIPIGEPRFLEEGMVKLARDSGVAEGNIVRNLRGEGAKPVILSTIGDSKGSTTIHFGAHGGEKHQMLTQGGAGEGFGLNEPGAISYVELGDALIQRVKNGESLKNVNILFDSCHSYDFTKNLYEHLQTEGKGIVMDLPYIITETNRGQVGKSDFNDAEFGSSFLRGLYETKQRNNPLILNNVYQAERSYFGEEDGAIFIPSGSGVLPIGSSHDDLEVPKPVDSEEKSPTYLEISQIESEMQKKLVA